MLSSCAPTAVPPQDVSGAATEPFRSLQIATAGAAAKKKRRPAGTPDPDAEVVSLSPRTLLESDRYVCEICNQGFQRDQNLQMHRRRHKVPWKLLKREAGEAARKRVFVCPEPTCLHHDPSHALGDLVGIKKHFRRKHSGHRQWACSRCSKAYAVHSDYKAHLKTCGTRGHTCDCGRVFSRVESFIEHQDACSAGRPRAAEASSSPGRGGGVVVGAPAAASSSQQQQQQQLFAVPASLSRTASSASPSSDLVVSPVAWPATGGGGPAMASPRAAAPAPAGGSIAAFHHRFTDPALSPPTPCGGRRGGCHTTHSLELQLMPPRTTTTCAGGSLGGTPVATAVGYYASSSPHSPAAALPSRQPVADAMRLQLSIGFGGARDDGNNNSSSSSGEVLSASATRLKEAAHEQLRLAMAEKAAADEARAQAKRQAELADQELATARRMRHQAQVELSRAHALRDHAIRQVDATQLQITCYSCRHKFRARAAAMISSDVASYVSSVVTEGGDAEVDNDGNLHRRRLNADDGMPRSHSRTMAMDLN
ncbi:zinc finger protein SHOOT GRAVITROPISM 5-like [Oryza glaberrima]|uniref:C2H2-type domain-containing protein n=1 Tax=Oryza glaberrima TaxID=4538 RepID=I1QRL3_ORYGL|nr:zinc finger protein SHOOT GRAVITROPISM 5-like [Oryza glaberrima]